MFDAAPSSTAGHAVAQLRTAVSGLLEVDRAALAPSDLLELIREVEDQVRRLAAVDQANVAELQARHVAHEMCYRDAKALLVDMLRIDRGEAKRRVDAARDLGPRITLQGEPLPPVLPQLADAVAAGEVSMGHVRHIVDFVDKLPDDIDPDLSESLQTHLLACARQTYPANVGKIATVLLARLDQDGVPPAEPTQRRAFGLRVDSDGWSTPHGRFSPRLTAVLTAVLDSLAAPQPIDERTPDDRTAPQRRHDGLLAALERLLRAGDLPDVGGAPVTVLVTVSESDLRRRTGFASSAHGNLVPVEDVIRMAGDAEVIPVYLADAGGVMAYGRSKRLATPAQRRALAARDRGCSRPGCTAPPGWCEVHHVVPWSAGGDTDIGNLALACPRDHDLLDQGWDIEMLDGVPHWRAPSWIDPARMPRRNDAHHAPVRFGAPSGDGA